MLAAHETMGKGMKAFVITLSRVPESLTSAQAALAKLHEFGLSPELWEGTYGNEAEKIFAQEGRTLHPTSFKGVPVDEAYQKLCSPLGVLGCFYSHYRLWQHCASIEQPILIFEDDVILYRTFHPVQWKDILLLATGKYVHTLDFYKDKLYNPSGPPEAVKPKGKVMPGAVGYGITPRGARKLLNCYSKTYLPEIGRAHV